MIQSKLKFFRTLGFTGLAFLAGMASLPGAQSARPATPTAAATKLIALTFDDGPKPYVLFGTQSGSGVHSASLLDLLDRDHVKATFFVMGWRLSKNSDALCRKVDGGPCREGAEEEHKRGHEIENHTFGHGDFKLMEKRYGDAWILNDIEKGSVVVSGITGARPHFLRPPDWDIWPEMQRKIEAQGYHVMSKSTTLAPELRDVDSEDYFCVGHDLSKCPKPSDYDYVIRTLAQRERHGIGDHILVFHELPQSVELLTRLIPELQQRGYRFVTLQEYSKAVVSGK